MVSSVPKYTTKTTQLLQDRKKGREKERKGNKQTNKQTKEMARTDGVSSKDHWSLTFDFPFCLFTLQLSLSLSLVFLPP